MTNMQNPAPGSWEPADWPPGPGQPRPGGYQQPYAPAPPQYAAGYQVPPPYQQAGWPGAALPPVRTYLVPAILVTLFCCLPTGIVGIIYASQVSSRLSVGDYQGAVHASRLARLWTIISLVIFVAAAVAGVVLAFILTASSSSIGTS